MGMIHIGVRDDLKEKFGAHCSTRNVTMTKMLVDFMLGAVGFAENEPERVEKCTCLLCGFEWVPRSKVPVCCPGCKSYIWNDVAASCKRKKAREQIEIVREEKEQRILLREFKAEYNRIMRKTQFQTMPEVAVLTGTSSDKLRPYLNKEKPVRREQIEFLKTIQP